MRAERGIKDRVTLEHIAHVPRVARLARDLEQDTGELHLAVVLLVLLVRVPARFTRLRYIDGSRHRGGQRRFSVTERAVQQRVLRRLRADAGRFLFGDRKSVVEGKSGGSGGGRARE